MPDSKGEIIPWYLPQNLPDPKGLHKFHDEVEVCVVEMSGRFDEIYHPEPVDPLSE